MADPQMDWEACGQRRRRAQRLAGVVASREQERQEELNHRRCRLRELLQGEEERWQEERNCRLSVLQARQHAERQETIDNLQTQQEEHRLRHGAKHKREGVQIKHPQSENLSLIHCHAVRQEAIDNLQSQQEEHRLRQVRLADEQRERERNHQYREQYWQEVQRYINRTRPLDIALRDHMRNNFGLAGKKSARRSGGEQATTYF